MAEKLSRSLTLLAERGEPRGADVVFRDAQPAAVPSPTAKSPRPNLAVAGAAAAVVLVFVGLVIWLLKPFDSTEELPVVTRPDAPFIDETLPESAALWRLEGTGDNSVECPVCQERGIFLEITHTGSGPFIVTPFTAEGDFNVGGIREANSGELFLGARRIMVSDRRPAGSEVSALTLAEAAALVDTTGDYRGRVFAYPADDRNTAALDIVADGAWTLAAYRIEDSARVFADTLRGQGDEVVLWSDTPCDADHITLDYAGSGRFNALATGAFGSSPLLFHEFGTGIYVNSALFEGQPWVGSEARPIPVTDGSVCERYFGMEIHADGPWTLTIVAAD
ncbi:MAG: hypothetical protein HKO82_14735 [Acidimicrobiia bacterium]|nr:hypothetical protein [Acidimicrobiia bacterium]